MGQAERNRNKAKKLGALDAEELIATVPYLARLLKKEQIAHFQKVLDAAVLNPMYQEQHRKALRNSVRAHAGKMVIYNEEKKDRAYKILHKRVKVAESDSYIRVDYNKMLTPDALQPRTNNPDEANYLAKVRHEVISKGIWLRLRQPWGSGRDPRKWAFSFTLGHNGDTIKTTDALIDRDELIRTVGGYYNAVTKGPVMTELERQVSRLQLAHENGESLHQEHARIRGETSRIIVKSSDVMGGADFPSTRIWDLPFELRLKAMEAITERNVWKAKLFLAASAISVEANGKLLAEYLSCRCCHRIRPDLGSRRRHKVRRKESADPGSETKGLKRTGERLSGIRNETRRQKNHDRCRTQVRTSC
jgi:hypothetical protein